jgi:hypothetical protein
MLQCMLFMLQCMLFMLLCVYELAANAHILSSEVMRGVAVYSRFEAMHFDGVFCLGYVYVVLARGVGAF